MEIDLSETAEEQWDRLPPNIQEMLLVEFEVAIAEVSEAYEE
jgi:hypothetical protein